MFCTSSRTGLLFRPSRFLPGRLPDRLGSGGVPVARWTAHGDSGDYRLEELTRPVLGIVVPHHGHDLSRVDHGPPVLALKADQAVRADLHAGQLLGLGHRERDRPGPADEHGNRPVPTDNGIEQIMHRLAGHLPSPPGIATSMMPRDGSRSAGGVTVAAS